jgi:hypothetical protein
MKTKPFQEGVDESALLIESLVIESASASTLPRVPDCPRRGHSRSTLIVAQRLELGVRDFHSSRAAAAVESHPAATN